MSVMSVLFFIIAFGFLVFLLVDSIRISNRINDMRKERFYAPSVTLGVETPDHFTREALCIAKGGKYVPELIEEKFLDTWIVPDACTKTGITYTFDAEQGWVYQAPTPELKKL